MDELTPAYAANLMMRRCEVVCPLPNLQSVNVMYLFDAIVSQGRRDMLEPVRYRFLAFLAFLAHKRSEGKMPDMVKHSWLNIR